jgi:hypothetical protein
MGPLTYLVRGVGRHLRYVHVDHLLKNDCTYQNAGEGAVAMGQSSTTIAGNEFSPGPAMQRLPCHRDEAEWSPPVVQKREPDKMPETE